MICTDLKPIQMSPAGNLILNTIAKIWNLESQNVKDRVAGLTEKGTGVVKSFETFKIIMIIKKHKCGFMKEIYTEPQITKSALQDIAFLMQVAEHAQHK